MSVHQNIVKSVYKFEKSSQRSSSSNSRFRNVGASVYYNIYNMLWLRGSRWWLFPDEVVGSSYFVVDVGSDVYWLLRSFANGKLGDINVLGIDAAAGYGKSLAAIKLAVDLSYDGWLIIVAFHSHELGRKLFEYVLRYSFIKHNLVGKWYKKVVGLGPLVLPRVDYIGGMERYCPFFDVVADMCSSDDKSCNVVKWMLSKISVPPHMWGKSIKFLIEHKILNAKQFCDVCPLMKKKGRLRSIPKDYWPDKLSRFGSRILYTMDVKDIVEKYLFLFIYDYDSRRKQWKRYWMSKYIKMIDPHVGVCPRRLLLKPIFSRRYKRKSDGKVVFYNYWLYHGGLVILAPYELALKIARIAYHVRGGRKILLIVDEADALFFKKSYVPVFPPSEFRKELELVKRYIEFFRWLLKNVDEDFDSVFRVFMDIVGRYIRKRKVFLKDLVSWILSNKDRIKCALECLYNLLYKYAVDYYGSNRICFDDILSNEVFKWLSDEFASFIVHVDDSGNDNEFNSVLNYFDGVSYECMRLWNILYVLSVVSQKRLVVNAVDSGEYVFVMKYGGGRYVGKVYEVNVNKKISPLYSLYLLRNSIVSLIMINNMLYYEYYPYLYEIFELASKNVKVILLSATLYTYFYNLHYYIDSIASKHKVRYRVITLLNSEDIYFRDMRKRVRIYEDYRLRNIRVHNFIQFLPKFAFRFFVLKFNKSLYDLVEICKNRRCIIVVQNKLSAKYVAKVFSSVFKESPIVFDSGYYFKGKVLITWLRSKLNRGVSIHDIDRGFVPELFIFVGTFLSSVQRVKVYDINDVASHGYVAFDLWFVKNKYFVGGVIDVIYGTEVLCWVEQFVGRSLRVSRMYDVCVHILLPYGVARYDVSMYLSAIVFLPDLDDVQKRIDELDKKWIEYYMKIESCKCKKLRSIYEKRLKRVEELLIDIEKLIIDGFGLGVLFKLDLGFLIRDVISRFKEILSWVNV
ncbi:MAG: hypothetical protein DRO40_05795 [Thermoprotei archaeon]|nr:MAG: hypothetical protein DRO40_05795 [Thermoprotei archaeon]